jgi:hypothetical protein
MVETNSKQENKSKAVDALDIFILFIFYFKQE